MNRPPFVSLALLALSLGAGSAAVEVGVRAGPRLGLSTGEALLWLAVAVGLYAAYALAAAGVAWAVAWRARGLVVAALVAVQGLLYYRFELFLNEFFYDPRVWGGLLAVGVGSLALGVGLDALLTRWERRVQLVGVAAMAVGVVLLLVRHGEPVTAPADGGPSVLLITLDTTRPDRIGAYGADNATPNIDALAASGVRFDQAIATAPLTEPSHLALLSGVSPHISGVVSNGTPLGERPLVYAQPLHDAGWNTAGFVSAFPLHGRYGWGRFFSVYDDDFGGLPGLHRLSLVKGWDQVALRAHALRERRGDATVRRALRWLGDHADERFFLWVHLFDPHAPYEAPDHPFDPPRDGEVLDLPGYWPPPHRAITDVAWLAGAYDAEIRYTDGLVGQLLAGLDAGGAADRTTVVLTADHGESLVEHDYLFDHGDNLYDPSLRIPLIIRTPGGPAGVAVPCQVSSLDVVPTLVALTGLGADPGRAGRDLLALAAGDDCPDRPVVSTTVAGRFVAVPPVDHALRTGAHKLISHDGADERGVSPLDCFDLSADPGELAPLGAACPTYLSPILDAELDGGGVPLAPDDDAETQNALKALGYIE